MPGSRYYSCCVWLKGDPNSVGIPIEAARRGPESLKLSLLLSGEQSFPRSWKAENSSKPISETGSVRSDIRSLAAIGMGSTDGKKMIIRRVPTSPAELFNIINPTT